MSRDEHETDAVDDASDVHDPVESDDPAEPDGTAEPVVPTPEPRTAAAPARPRTAGDAVRAVSRGFGELLVTLGVLLLLMVVYQLWWTNVTSAQAISTGRDDIIAGWRDAAPKPTPTETLAPAPMAEPAYGKGFGLLYIPRMRNKVWGLPLIQGTGKDVLARGAGHYVGTAMPGGVGNFAIAAHRSTHDEPFANIDALRAGDKVYVRTKDWWYVYTLVKDNPNLTPQDVWVVDPVPGQPGVTPTEKLLTMTTCTPRYGSTGRWAWWGKLASYSPTSLPPPDGIDPNA